MNAKPTYEELAKRLKNLEQALLEDSVERQWIEEAILGKKDMEGEFAKLVPYLLTSTEPMDISFQIMETARMFTKSRYGCVGTMDETGEALTNFAINREIWNDCDMPDKFLVMRNHGKVWQTILKDGKPGITRDAPNSIPLTGKLVGHVPITDFMGVPAMSGSRMVGLIALADPEKPYTADDLSIVERLAALYTLAVQAQNYRKDNPF